MGERDKEIDKRDLTSWNISSEQAELIAKLISEATYFSVEGNLGGKFNHWRSIRELINPLLKKGEQAYLDKLERMGDVYAGRWLKFISEGYEDDQKNKETSWKYAGLIRKYQRKIMDLLKELGFFPAREDKTRMNF